jgi:hypothetical protein
LPKAQKIVFASALTEWVERLSDTFMNNQEIIEIEEADEDTEPSEE